MSLARPLRVAVLGAGIMGSSTALLLARHGAKVRLFDAAPAPMSGASRWNEGKIHLGHLYAADPSLATARCVLPGGLAFPNLLRELVGVALDDLVTPQDDLYVVHRDSVVPAPAMAAYLDAVTALAREHPDARAYFSDLRAARTRTLDAAELRRSHDTGAVTAGFVVPERSIDTRRVADHFVDALRAQAGIDQAMATRVVAVERDLETSPLHVVTDRGREGPFDIVVNALWEGRLAVDTTLGLPVPDEHSHRYRLSLFLDTSEPVDVPSTVIATGPFGDVKNYGGGRYYLSWYRAGLVAEGNAVAPPPAPHRDPADRLRTSADILAGLQNVIPAVASLAPHVVDRHVEGGWVYATGSGSLADRGASLHRRDRLGISRSGGYFSVDTGKYSVAPWLARELVATILGN